MQLALHCYAAAKNYAYQDLNLSKDDFSISLLLADEAESQDVFCADALILFCPENFAAIAGGMKNFLDRSFYPWLRAIDEQGSLGRGYGAQAAKPYQIVIDTGNDGSFCLQQMQKILKGVCAKAIQEPMIILAKPGQDDLADMQSLGQGFVEAMQQGLF